jgi:tRNA pseudouridine38-40 synthase
MVCRLRQVPLPVTEATGKEQRWALAVEYDGSGFAGFQRQKSSALPTVQGALDSALSQVGAAPIQCAVAGRTDAGVHATGQVVHFDAPEPRPVKAWVRGVNSLAGPAITVHWAHPVPSDFHARFSAQWRRYRYWLSDAQPPRALLRDRVTYVPGALEASAMHEAAQVLLGERDFSSFRAAGCQARHGRRFMRHLNVRRVGALVSVEVEANAFLLHMVRNIVGALIEVGRGRGDGVWLDALRAAEDRRLAPPTAPPQGLYLEAVGYEAALGLPPFPSSLPFGAGAFC